MGRVTGSSSSSAKTAARTAIETIGRDELNQKILDVVPGGVVVVAADGSIVQANEEGLRILGMSFDHLTNRYINDFAPETIHEDGSPCPVSDYPVARALMTGEKQPPVTIGIRRPDASMVWAVFRAVPLFGATDELLGAVATFIDITDRKRVEAALRESEEKLRALAESVPDFVFTIDREAKIRFINRMLPIDVGRSAVGISITALVPTSQAPIMLEQVERVFATGEIASFEIDGRGPKGHLARYENRIGPIRHEGNVVGAVLVARDITERLALMQQVNRTERMASVGILAAGVAHEINNPLAYLLMNLGYVIDRWPESMETTKQAMLEAREGAMRVRDIVRGLKTFSRDDPAIDSYVDVREVLDAAIEVAQSEIRPRATLVRDYESVALVRASGGRLGQVFLNLLVNAAHAVAPGQSGDILVSTRPDPEHGEVIITIADNGVGISPEHVEKIFDPFFTTKPVGQGTGLGLSICHNLVSEVGGRIDVESALGVGTTFAVRLPASEATVPSAPPAHERVEPATAATKRILVIDDDVFVARSLHRLLAPAHDVAIATSGFEAIRLLERETFDVVFCDVMMPGLSGLEVHDEVAKKHPELARRFVFVTGGAFSGETERRLEALGRRCIMKPFEAREILDAVTKTTAETARKNEP